MINKLHNWAIIAASTSLCLTVFEVVPTQAADFASFAFSFGSAYGELSFKNTKLKGNGIESISFSELSTESEFKFFMNPYTLYPPIEDFRTDNPDYYSFYLKDSRTENPYYEPIEVDQNFNNSRHRNSDRIGNSFQTTE